jgi:hypothetical protein
MWLRPNHSLKLTESTACFSAARKKLFREIATRSARIVSGDLATRCRSSQRDPFGISSGPLGGQDWHLTKKIKTLGKVYRIKLCNTTLNGIQQRPNLTFENTKSVLNGHQRYSLIHSCYLSLMNLIAQMKIDG